MQVEIISPQGIVSYRRPHTDPMISEALRTNGYSVRCHGVGMSFLHELPCQSGKAHRVEQTPKFLQVFAPDVSTVTPKRIQLKRTKGWKKPEGAIVVSRPSKWGNPFPVCPAITLEKSLEMYRFHIERETRLYNPNVVAQYRRLNVYELRGKDLCCWCPEGKPCHADVLLELANK